MKKYNLINNTLGWLIFLVAAVTYLLTIEPTASFWDCPEFIAQGFKTEIGHPPGNPIFILAARFAANFAGGDIMSVAKCVNAMSAIFSALTILLLFWSITHLVKKLVVDDGQEDKMTAAQYLVVMGSGVCGALAYTWSDTFWFSAVEAEVYAFSSFCTALVFWLILKWENRADDPSSDRWLILIAYVIGVSLGVHLLNLLCIPAIALIFYYRKWENTSVKGSLLTLLISFAIIALVLYGLEPGFVELGEYFDLFFVNTLGMHFNTGVLFYALLLIAVLAWNLWELHHNTSDTRIKVSFAAAVFLSGMLFIGDNLLIPAVLLIALLVYLFKFCKHVPVRVLGNISLSILVIFIGFACYALILIRSSQNTPLDENSPNTTFALAKYLSREQYGETPLFYGRTFKSDIQYQDAGNGTLKPAYKEGRAEYARQVKKNASDPDRYILTGHKRIYKYVPEQNMLFPRIHSEAHESQYRQWLNMQGETVYATVTLDRDGKPAQKEARFKPTVGENWRFFFDYQLNYMYWRYFMWNFAGRQNDIQGLGEVTQGNWISGFSFIDNPRLGDQSLLPDDYGKGNKGHNVFYLLPLIMGIIGLLWQAYRGKRGIEQFWVVFFLFFMTGIAIVLYLNQTPNQPRERDYAYAGSFYAYCIWVGMGVAGLWSLVTYLINGKKKKEDDDKKKEALASENTGRKGELAVAVVAALIGLAVPLQMVSQTWDDHDRSGRYAARDFGMNYLSSVDKNGIIFCNGDNDTFPLWYLQEVENYRTDVRAVNFSYLSTDWYIAQMQRAAYDSAPLPMLAGDTTFAYDNHQFNYFIEPSDMRVSAEESLKNLYSPESSNNRYGMSEIKYPRIYIPVNVDEAIAQGVITEDDRAKAQSSIELDLKKVGGGLNASQVMTVDLVNASVTQGWKRPCFFAMTVPESYQLGLTPYLRNTGMAYQVTPLLEQNPNRDIPCNTDKMYDVVTTKFRWGGLDKAEPGSLYLDETVRRMVTTVRTSMLSLANDLIQEGVMAKQGGVAPAGKNAGEYATDRFTKAHKVLDMIEEKLPVKACPYSIQMGQLIAQAYSSLASFAEDKPAGEKAKKIIEQEIMRYAQYMRYYQSLSPSKYERLTRIDQFIDNRYFAGLLQNYAQIDRDGFQPLLKRLEDMGVNLERINAGIEPQPAEPQVQQQPAAIMSDTARK